MAEVISLRKPDVHQMTVSREDDWLIWHCDQCRRKVVSNQITGEWYPERQGDLLAHHEYQ